MTRRVSPHIPRGLPLAASLALGMALAGLPGALLWAQDGAPIDPQGDPELEAIVARQAGLDPEPPPAIAPEPGSEGAASQDETAGEVVVTVDDIQNLIALPAQIGREIDEKPVDDKFNAPGGPELLRENPPFVYVPANLPDPLIIPWVRDQVIFQEKMDEARRLLAEGLSSKALPTIKQAQDLLNTVPPPPDAAAAEELAAARMEIARAVSALTAVSEGDTGPIEVKPAPVINLPEPVRATTNGVIVDRENPNESMVIVGDFMLRPGQTVPKFPTVRVKSVGKQAVVYEYRNKEFVVNVRSD